MAPRLAAAIALLALALVAFASPGRRAPDPCPVGTHADAAQLVRIVRQLATSSEGRGLLRRAAPLPLSCFGGSEDGVLRDDGVLVLADRRDERAAAARLAHLLVHHLERFTFEARASRPCEDRVSEAVAAEARAHGTELRLRRALAAPARLLPSAVEEAYWASSEVEGLALLREHLRGSGLAEAYRRRCQQPP